MTHQETARRLVSAWRTGKEPDEMLEIRIDAALAEQAAAHAKALAEVVAKEREWKPWTHEMVNEFWRAYEAAYGKHGYYESTAAGLHAAHNAAIRARSP